MDYDWWKPRIRLIGPGFLEKLRCNCPGVKEVFCGSEEPIIGASIANECNSNEKLKTPSSADGLGFPQLLSIIELLGAFASRQDLKNLKQVSQLYYKLLNPIYLDLVESILSIVGRDELLFPWERQEIWMSGTKRKQSFDCGIPPSTWNPESAYIFRNLIAPHNLLWYDYPELNYDGIHLNSIISQIRPYITILHMPKLSHPNCLDFINQFPKLEQLKIEFNAFTGTEMIHDSLTTLKNIFQNLKKKSLNLKLKVESNYWPILEAFGNTSGTTIEIYIRFTFGPENLRTFTSLSDNSEKWRNIKFISLELTILADSMVSELISVTTRYVKHQDQIQKLGISFYEFPLEHSPSEESTIQKCLVKLSPILSRLALWRVNRWNVLSISSGPIWQNLGYLRIIGLELPLDFLKGTSTSSSFPALADLTLETIDQDVCIFHDPQMSHNEAIMTYFGNLPKLISLYIRCKVGTIDRLKPELVSSLKELRPKLEVRSSKCPGLVYDKRSIHSY